MKIAVIGPGAMGCLLAGTLACRTGHEVWLLDHDAGRAAALGNQIIVEEGGRRLACPLGITTQPEKIGPAALVLLCVKSNSVRVAITAAASLLSSGSLLVAFQNGIGHLPALAETAGRFTVAIGVTAQGATLLAPGHVRHAGAGPTRIGLLPGKQVGQGRALPAAAGHAKLRQAAMVLTEAGIATEVADDIMTQVWNKLLINVGINALTAIYNCTNGALLDIETARARMERAVGEAAAVARSLGIPIMADPFAATLEVCRATAANVSSMLQDVRNRRPTEIDAINGAIVKAARAAAIKVLENERLVREIKDIEAAYAKNSA